ncbi:MAG: hypothetical protein CAK86_03815 [Opitutia bacterium AMD-G1]|nr:MAG: hypothetical protein CAK86_03815 [Opitutae bacterium AMD-G1]
MSVLAVRSLTEVLVSLGTNVIILIIYAVVILLLPSFVLGVLQGLIPILKDFNKEKYPFGYICFYCFVIWAAWRILGWPSVF